MTAKSPDRPEGAVAVGDWNLDDGLAREFVTASRTMITEGGAVEITSGGYQYGNGTTHRHLSIDGATYLTIDETRELIGLLQHLVDDAEQHTH